MIQTIPNNELSFDDIFDVVVPDWWDSPWFWYALGAGIIFFIGVCFLVVYCFRLYKKKKKQAPLEIALQRIVALKKVIQEDSFKNSLNDGLHGSANEVFISRGKEFYVEFFGLIKQYLDNAYALKTASKTDSELYRYLKTCDSSKIPEFTDWVTSINALIERGICIKFGQGLSDRVVLLSECEKVHNILIKASQREKRA